MFCARRGASRGIHDDDTRFLILVITTHGIPINQGIKSRRRQVL